MKPSSIMGGGGSGTHSTDIADRVAWTHCYDADDSAIQTYLYDAADDPTFGALAMSGTRVALIPDRGSQNVPLVKDDGSHNALFGLPAAPGPLLEVDSAKFGGRNGFFSDRILLNQAFFDNFHSALFSGTLTDQTQPWWCALLVRASGYTGNENAAIDGSPGMVTFGMEPTANIQTWQSFVSIGGTITSPTFTPTDTKPFLGIVKMSGPDDSFLDLTYRTSVLKSERTHGSQNGNGIDIPDWHIGWSHSNWCSFFGLKLGDPTETEITAVRTWAAQFL